MLLSAPFEALLFFIFFWIVGAPTPLATKPEKELVVVPLFAPPMSQPEPRPKPVHISLPKPPQLAVQPKIELPKVETARQQVPSAQTPKFEMPKTSEVRPAPMAPAQLPKLAVVHPPEFSTGSSARATVKLPAAKVQTGGFGNPNGLPGKAEGGNPGNVPKLGSFDLPSGPGNGNGSGGARGISGVVASAGFGNGSAVASNSRHGKWTVETSSFGDAANGRGKDKAANQPVAPDFIPAKIISKPSPVYPPEARKLHLEGEVLLSVVFEVSGHVQVLHVVRGLGHGMDEAAERAAEGIVFKPAQRDGQPVDMQAVVHIIFQLAY